MSIIVGRNYRTSVPLILTQYYLHVLRLRYAYLLEHSPELHDHVSALCNGKSDKILISFS